MNQVQIISIEEQYLLDVLRSRGAFIYPVSAQFPLKERIRRAIIDGKYDYAILGKNSATKKCETFMQCFERVFREPLTAQPNKRATA